MNSARASGVVAGTSGCGGVPVKKAHRSVASVEPQRGGSGGLRGGSRGRLRSGRGVRGGGPFVKNLGILAGLLVLSKKTN